MEHLDISLGNMNPTQSNVDIIDPTTQVTPPDTDSTTPPVVDNNVPPVVDTDEPNNTDTDNISTVESFLSGTQESMTQEEVEERDKLYAIYGVVGYDANRNLLDKDGKPVLMYSHLEKYLSTGELPINNEGKLVFADGSIVEGVQYTSYVDEANSVIRDEFGFEISNLQEINQIENEEERKQALYKTIVHDSQVAGVQSFLENNPTINEFYTHLRLGGTADSFKGRGIDYEKIDIEKLGDADKLGLVKDLYNMKNLSIPDNYLKFVQTDANALNEAASDAIKELATHKREIDKENQIRLQEQQAEETKRVNSYWNEVKQVVDKGTLLDTYNIPEKEKDTFFKYLSAPIKNGLSQDMIDEDNITQEERLLLSYIRFKGKNISEFINSRTSTAITNRRRDALRSFKPAITSNSQSSTSDVSYKGISLDNIRTSNS